MVILLVDGDYLLSGFRPDSDASVRGAVERLEAALTSQLLESGSPQHRRIDTRVVLFSTMLMNSLEPEQRNCLVSSLRRLRFQVSVLESVRGRPGSPIDAALCTKAIMFAMLPGSVGADGGSGGGGGGPHQRQVFCFVAANAYLASALDLITSQGCDALFTVYEGDEVAEELLGFVSASFGDGIATMPKMGGVSFIPNTEAASAALAALQQEGRDLPLSVVQELQRVQSTLSRRNIYDGTQAEQMGESRRRVQEEQARFVPPPPLPGVPSPFEVLPAPAAPPSSSSAASSAGDGATDSVSVETSPAGVVQAAAPPEGPPPATGARVPVAVRGRPPVSTQLPVGWALVYDEEARRHYFAHRAAGGAVRSTWEHPLGPAAQRELDDAVASWARQEHERQLKEEEMKQQQQQQQQQQQPPEAAAPALPAGWEERVDVGSGRKFYVNHNTRQTSWSPPTDHSPSPAAGADDWEERRDPTGRVFFVNHRTRQTAWERPAPASATAEWEARMDPRSGRTYYINHRTRQTSWTVPT